MLLDVPSLLFFSTYSFLVFFWVRYIIKYATKLCFYCSTYAYLVSYQNLNIECNGTRIGSFVVGKKLFYWYALGYLCNSQWYCLFCIGIYLILIFPFYNFFSSTSLMLDISYSIMDHLYIFITWSDAYT